VATHIRGDRGKGGGSDRQKRANGADDADKGNRQRDKDYLRASTHGTGTGMSGATGSAGAGTDGSTGAPTFTRHVYGEAQPITVPVSSNSHRIGGTLLQSQQQQQVEVGQGHSHQPTKNPSYRHHVLKHGPSGQVGRPIRRGSKDRRKVAGTPYRFDVNNQDVSTTTVDDADDENDYGKMRAPDKKNTQNYASKYLKNIESSERANVGHIPTRTTSTTQQRSGEDSESEGEEEDTTDTSELLNIVDQVLGVGDANTRDRDGSESTGSGTASGMSRIGCGGPPDSVKKDPVALYHYYQRLWNQNHIPGANRHMHLRWNVRAKTAHYPCIEGRPVKYLKSFKPRQKNC